MADTTTKTVGTCTLWTPWGPQPTKTASPKLASIRRTLRRLKPTKTDARKARREELSLLPECAYEP